MKCDSCGRERTDDQLSRHDSAGIRFCRDRQDCHNYRKDGRFAEVAQEIIDMLTGGGILTARCADNKDHACVSVVSPAAKDQIAALLASKLGQ